MASPMEGFLKALLGKVPQQVLKDIVERAPLEIVQRVEALSQVVIKPVKSFFIFPKTLLSRIHSSWFEEVASFCPKAFRKSALRAMQEEMGLEKKMFSDPVRRFLLQEALFKWPDRTMEEKEPPELSLLKECSFKQFHILADLVELYDLQEEVRKVLEKKKLQLLFERLSPIQQKFLKEILQGKKFHFCNFIKLDTFLQMEPAEASTFLHQGGLRKIGMVLRKESLTTCWFVLHRMDKESASLIEEGRVMESISCDLKQLQGKFIYAFQFIQR